MCKAKIFSILLLGLAGCSFNPYDIPFIGWRLEHYTLPYDEIYTGCGKPIAEAFVDDRAISVPKNPVESDFDEALIKMKRFMEDI